jgi:hypothetical protein
VTGNESRDTKATRSTKSHISEKGESSIQASHARQNAQSKNGASAFGTTRHLEDFASNCAQPVSTIWSKEHMPTTANLHTLSLYQSVLHLFAQHPHCVSIRSTPCMQELLHGCSPATLYVRQTPTQFVYTDDAGFVRKKDTKKCKFDT